MVYEGNEVFTEGLINMRNPSKRYTHYAHPEFCSAEEIAWLLSDDKMYVKERYTWYVQECIRITKDVQIRRINAEPILRTFGKLYVVQHSFKHKGKYDNMYKIGITLTTTASRIQNAHKEATFLKAPVELVHEWDIKGLATPRADPLHVCLEVEKRTIHKRLKHCNLKTIDPTYAGSATEWFVAPLETIQIVCKSALHELEAGILIPKNGRWSRT